MLLLNPGGVRAEVLPESFKLKLFSYEIQVVYVLKFFLWEMGYMSTMDIQHDRAGYAILRIEKCGVCYIKGGKC